MATRIQAIEKTEQLLELLPTNGAVILQSTTYTVTSLQKYRDFLINSTSSDGSYRGIDEKAVAYDPTLAEWSGFN